MNNKIIGVIILLCAITVLLSVIYALSGCVSIFGLRFLVWTLTASIVFVMVIYGIKFLIKD